MSTADAQRSRRLAGRDRKKRNLPIIHWQLIRHPYQIDQIDHLTEASFSMILILCIAQA